jgi:protein-L-isoaspartate O-methyltransferase
MGVIRHVLRRMFGRPQGALGRLGGLIMARTNADCAAWVAELLEIEPGDSVLEVGFGPGIAIQRVSELAPAGNVAGIDQSREMVEQAYRSKTTALTKPWRSTRCKSGRTPWPGCAKYGGS